MSDRRKISLILLGSKDSSKKELLNMVLGDDYQNSRPDTETPVHENTWCEVACPVNKSGKYNNIRMYFYERCCAMCLLLLDDGFSVDRVWQQINELHKESQIPLEVIRLVLPRQHRDRSPSYSVFNVCTMDEVCSEVRKLKRQLEIPDPHTESFHQRAGGRSFQEPETKGARVNLVLLGMTGSGKSACGNTILGKTHFLSKTRGTPVTTECQVGETEMRGMHVRVIDTPDIFDDDISKSQKNTHVMSCKKLCEPDPCVYLLVLQVGRFTDGERDVIRKLEKAFGSRATDQTIILFTCSEELQRADVSKEEFLNKCDPHLKKVINACGHRCVFFSNKATSSSQVTELMQAVSRTLTAGNRSVTSFFTSWFP